MYSVTDIIYILLFILTVSDHHINLFTENVKSLSISQYEVRGIRF